jgi:transposase InsO family protein
MSKESSFSLRSLLEKEKLKNDGSNFMDWHRTLRIVLRREKKEYVLTKPLPNKPSDTDKQETKDEYTKHEEDELDVSSLLVTLMSPELQRQFEAKSSYIIMSQLKKMFQEQARVERYNVTKGFLGCKMAEGTSVSAHMLQMMSYVEQLEKLECPVDKGLATDIVLNSLPSRYSSFIMNYHMHGMEKSLEELHGMLKTAEADMKKGVSHVLAVSEGGRKVKKGKGKSKRKGDAKGKAQMEISSTPKAKTKVPSDVECYYCKNKGHWKRSCPKYLEDKKAGKVPTSSGMFVIEVNLATSISDWILDTGSCAHICSNVQALKDRRMLGKGEVQLHVGNGASVAAVAVGNVELSLPSGLVIKLRHVYFVPSISRNIISISCMDMDGFVFTIENNRCSFYRNGLFYGSSSVRNGLYLLEMDKQVLNINNKRLKAQHESETLVWHCRLGHINDKRIKKLQEVGLLGQFDFKSIDVCESCLLGKMTKAPFTKSGERTNELLALIHTDVCGPMSICARGGYSYFITFTDDFSRYGYVYLLRHKSESFEKFKEFKNEVENQLGKRIKAMRSDRGGEYLSNEFGDYLKEYGIVSQLTPPGTPQWNGVSERRNRTLLDMVRSMMSQTSLPPSFWSYALETAAFTLNRVPSKSVEKTPYEIWHGKVPNMSFLKIWGCEAYIKRLISDKLGPKSDKCLFIGYPKETKGYYFYQQSESKVVVARHAVFLEKEFLARRSSGSSVQLEEVHDATPNNEIRLDPIIPPMNEEASGSQQEPISQTVAEEVQVSSHEAIPQGVVEEGQEADSQRVVEEAIEPQAPVTRRSSRVSHPPERWLGLHEVTVLDTEDPLTYAEAMASPDSAEWLGAMQSEMQSMYDNQVWNLVDPPVGIKPIENKWVFKRKSDMDGNLTTYKARLVAKGFKQIQGVDYDETFSPVAMFKSIRIILAIAAFHDYEIWQMDVKTAFLNGDLEEDVYMTQPHGFVDPSNAKKVCKLQRSIYGLKQASRSWNKRFDKEIKMFDFVKCEEEPCVYKRVSGSAVIFLVLYVDDILLIGNNIPSLNSVKTSLMKVFSMKDLGEAAYILGIKIYRDRSRRLIGLSQSVYIDKVLKRFSMQDSKKGFLPMSSGIPLSKKQCPSTTVELDSMKRVPYASAIGSIMYAMICTRPDVSYSLSVTSRYQANPGLAHWTAVKNILKYLKRSKDMFLVYGGESELVVRGYTDASFQTDHDDMRSQSGYVFILNGGAVSWKSSKQETTADSTTEAEYIAASEAAKEGFWIKKFLAELEVVPSSSDPVELLCDNNGAIAQAKEPRSHQKSKHVQRRYHLIREIINRGDVKICRVDTDSNTADPLTKPLSQAKHTMHTASMGMRYIREWI